MRLPSSFLSKTTYLAGAALLLAPVVVYTQAQTPPPPAAPAPAAQQAPAKQEPQDGDAVFTSDSRLVPLNVTVTDKSGKLVTNLTKSSFQVLENGVVQQIKDFKHEDVPVSLGLIIDNSGSMREKRQAVESSALALVRDSNPQDEEFVVNFNDDAFLDTDFTSDIRMLEQGLAKIDSRGGTAMRQAMSMSIEHLKRRAKRDKKVILVVTDGNDNASTIGLEALVREAQQNDVLIYAIGLLSEEEKKDAAKAKHALSNIVEATGGLAFYPKDVTQVEEIAHEVAHDIRNQYTITYTPTNQALDGSFRTIHVKVNSPGNPVARTRMGYYASQHGDPPSAAKSGSSFK